MILNIETPKKEPRFWNPLGGFGVFEEPFGLSFAAGRLFFPAFMGSVMWAFTSIILIY